VVDEIPSDLLIGRDLCMCWMCPNAAMAAGALQPDRPAGVRGLFEPEEERLTGRDECGERLVGIEFAYGFVVQAGGGLDERGWHGQAGERAVDEEGAGGRAALQASVFSVAQWAGRGGEVGAQLVGVGAVRDQQLGWQVEGASWVRVRHLRIIGPERTSYGACPRRRHSFTSSH
jgi:hypothetical protein